MSKSVCEEKNYQGLYQEHFRHLYNFMYYKCGDREKAEDLTHESFIKLWERCKEVVFDKVKSFLFTVANNTFLNLVKHEKVVLSFNKDYTTQHNSEDPQYQLEEQEFGKKLESAISNLPEGQREAFLMHRIDKMKYGEIAEVLGISVKAVEKRIHNAFVNLKEAVEELQKRKI